MVSVPGMRNVTVVRRVRRRDGLAWARDTRGDAVYDHERITVRCSVQPGGSVEDESNGRDQVSTVATLYAPQSWPGGPIDSVEFDGLTWSVQGRPERWIHPRLGHVKVTVREAGG